MEERKNNDEVYIQTSNANDAEDEYEQTCIGILQEERSPSGELIEMYIETFEGVLDDLVGDNLMYFIRVSSDLYRYSRFEQYPDCDDIDLDIDDEPDRRSRTELKEILEEAERTIKVIREGGPIQRYDARRPLGRRIENLTTVRRSTRLGRGLGRR